MKFISLIIKNSPWLFVLAILTSTITGLCSTLTIKLIHMTVKSSNLDVVPFLIEATLYLTGFIVLGILSSFFISKITRKTVSQIRLDLSNKLLNSQYAKIEHRLEDIFPIITEDVNVIAFTIGRLPSVITGLATVIGGFVYLSWISYQLTFFTLLIFVAVFLINLSFLPRSKRLSYMAREKWDLIYKNFEALVYGIKELKMNKTHQDYFLHEQFDKNLKEENKYKILEQVNFAASSKFGDAFLLAGICVFLVVINNLQLVTFDFFAGFLMVVLFLLSPLSNATGFMRHVKRSEVSLDKINNLGFEMSQKAELTPEQLQSVSPQSSIITLRDAKFTYDTEAEFSFTVGPISLEINKNEIVYITGGNGSGKTTLLKMICGLYPLESGHISYLGNELNERSMITYRDQFSGVFTEYYLFQDVGYLRNQITDKSAVELLSRLEMDHKIQLKDFKYSTIKLSLGQKKRIALMTAALEGRDILIFDEWAANQDPHFKAMFYESLIPYFKSIGKTIIAITHDEKYFKMADKVVKLADGGQVS